MRGILIISILFVSALCVDAQKIDKWTNYSDMSDVSYAVTNNGDIWASTLGGAFTGPYTSSHHWRVNPL